MKEKLMTQLLSSAGVFAKNDHFVYKAGTHGNLYINKDALPLIGARNLANLIKEVSINAVRKGFQIKDHRIGVIGPAMGTIPFSLSLAAALEELIKNSVFFPARTDLVTGQNGKKLTFCRKN